MQPSVHFDSAQFTLKKGLLPIGMGFLSEELLRPVSDPRVTRDIDKTVGEFHMSIVHEIRKTRSEPPFISKPTYILSPKHRQPTEDELVSLLADSGTLFSQSYQQYGTDHLFFLEYAKMQGKSTDEQRAFCRERALQGVPTNLRARTALFLVKFQELMTAKKWTPQKAEEEFISAVIPHGSYSCETFQKEIRMYAEKFLNALNNTQHELTKSLLESIRKDWPELELSQETLLKLYRDYFELIQKAPDTYFYQYRKMQTFFEKYSYACAVLRQWMPEFEIDEDKMPVFMCALEKYLFHSKDIFTVKEEKGHYRRTYKKYDETHYRLYTRKNEMLNDVIGRYRSWHEEDLNDVFFGLSEFSIDSSVSKLSKEEKQDNISALCELTKSYLKGTGYSVERYKNEYAQCVIKSLYNIGGKQLSREDQVKLFPFRYIMVCNAGTGRLFSDAGTITGKKISANIENPYLSKPSVKKQRIQRIWFLNELNRICCLERADRSQNWKHFLQVHGASIQSQEELNLWKKILYGGNVNYKEEAYEDIPPIELTLLCTEFLSNCLPVQYQSLYCYEGGRYTHTGGFARFLREHPEGLQECIQRIKKHNKPWGNPVAKYMKYWSGNIYDVAKIQDLCGRISDMIRWKSVPGASKDSLQKFCREAHLNEDSVEEVIAAETANIRVLLIEAAFRHILTENAEKMLRSHITNVLFSQQKFPNFKSVLLQ